MTTGLEAFFTPLAAELGVRHGLEGTLRLLTLAMARWAPIITLAPFMGGRLIPAPVRMGLLVLFSLLVLPAISQTAPRPLLIGPVEWWALVLKETFIGLVIGFAASLVFWGGEMGGRLIDTVRGTTTANLLIPQAKVQSTILGDVYFQLFIVLYLVSGAHLFFFAAVADSYRLLPPTELTLNLGGGAELWLLAVGNLFVIAVKIIAPALVVVMFLDIMLGVANRMAPQLNVHFLGMSLKASLASLALSLSLYYVLSMAGDLFADQQRWIELLFRQLSRPG